MLNELMLRLMNPLTDAMLENMLTESYPNNPMVMTTTFEKLSLRAVIEAGIRAETGKALSRPLGSPLRLSPWEQLLLNPRQLFQLPTPDDTTLETKVVIGPHAKKPLKLDTPILITGMSYGGSLNLPMKIALAKGASMAGTATNTGESAVSEEEREAADFLIGQYNRGGWLNTPEQLELVDAIEVQLGQGAWGGAVASSVKEDEMDEHLRALWKIEEGGSTGKHSRLPEVNSPDDVVKLIKKLKQDYSVPVGIKIAATHFMERELEVIAKTEADFICIDGQEGGTAAAAPTLEDDMGLPTLFGLGRTIHWLREQNLRDKFTVIAAGGFRTPGEMLKALALGADAVYIGSIAIIATLQKQMTKALPQHPAHQLALYNGALTNELDIEEGSQHLANFLISCQEEMKMALQAMGKKSIQELGRDDLVCLNPELARNLEIGYAGTPVSNYWRSAPLAAR
ncbi:glutamate synthase family protein [Desulfitobacterium dichloroeliminans LMG P-21439]|uniref:Glutamate synthase family protein n=1 Tax=Desulfitobacterium dichloroeliminans (strain LMG P-21439 / DCA1) TaxID=871963 RepID=L0F6J8_DESDL|nr:FMN-binding glutamate synthase family protein [Desulfitobacterium dichloroeliminans]AGA68563.1 glutamate synthase family protein [Desulfitobacterium dichloroeliminans LMG P-21439]